MDYLHELKINEQITNPLKNEDEIKCILKNKKKEQYYKFTYNPNSVIQNLKYNLINTKQFTKDELDEILRIKFQTEVKYNCCNCISIVLYFLDCKIENYLRYIQSIYRTVLNVEKKLPDWIVRIYFDKSVYKCLEKDKLEYPKIYYCFDKIFNSTNTEIYTYECNNFDSDDFSISSLRSLRFLPAIEEDTNICVFREADGIVSNLDCHNLDIFSKSDKLFYVVDIGLISFKNRYNDNLKIEYYSPVITREGYNEGSYSKWLQYYKIEFMNEFFGYNHKNYTFKKLNVIELAAGVLALKLKIKSEYYYLSINELSQHINSLQTESDSSNFIKTSNNKYYQKKILQIGFDEMLLLHIFKELISVNLINFKTASKVEYETYNQDFQYYLNLFLPSKKINLYEKNNYDNNILNKDVLIKQYQYLFEQNIINNNNLYLEDYLLDISNLYNKKSKNIFIFIYDSILLKNITCDFAFNLDDDQLNKYNITNYNNWKYNLNELINEDYILDLDKFYDSYSIKCNNFTNSLPHEKKYKYYYLAYKNKNSSEIILNSDAIYKDPNNLENAKYCIVNYYDIGFNLVNDLNLYFDRLPILDLDLDYKLELIVCNFFTIKYFIEIIKKKQFNILEITIVNKQNYDITDLILSLENTSIINIKLIDDHKYSEQLNTKKEEIMLNNLLNNNSTFKKSYKLDELDKIVLNFYNIEIDDSIILAIKKSLDNYIENDVKIRVIIDFDIVFPLLDTIELKKSELVRLLNYSLVNRKDQHIIIL